MAAPRISRRRVEARPVRLTGADGSGQLIIDCQDRVLGPVAAVRGFVLPLDGRERIHDVCHGIAGMMWTQDLLFGL